MKKVWKLLAIIGGVVAAAAIAVVVFLTIIGGSSNKNSYRTVTVHELSGSASVKVAKKSESAAFVGQNLYSGDDVTVANQSELTACLDNDKYLYAESGAHFWLEATGSEKKTKTVINTDAGDTIHYIENALSDDEVYKVNTPASTMAVRGTVFRVKVYSEDGYIYTLLEVYQGKVLVELWTTSHKLLGISKTVSAGEKALMRATEDFSEFLGAAADDGEFFDSIDYREVPQNVAFSLGKVMDNGEVLSIGKDLLFDYVEITEHIFEPVVVKEPTCTETGEERTICTVCGLETDETNEVPALNHPSTHWEKEGKGTCTKGINRNEICDICNVVVNSEKYKGKHTFGKWEITKAPDCSNTGTKERVCSKCGETETAKADKTKHSYGEWSDVKAATCTEKGQQKRTCTICGKEDTQSVAAIGHNYTYSTGSAATCDTDGYDIGVCQNCGGETRRTIAATGHSRSAAVTVISRANCTDAGSQSYECTVCHNTVVETISALGHQWSGWVVGTSVESCVSEGNYSRNCTVCGISESKTVPATGIHTYETGSCYHDADQDLADGGLLLGFTCYRVCTVCNQNDNSSATYLPVSGGEMPICPYCNTRIIW